ncbi:hypothetical protein [Croceibacterium aestuarii]|uniref:hypothetical protein n=1 Tax=Croceibacterium aestuarii TaxID=3064139 RepID=UPI00272DDF6A|nr:hypothetical protein [Croceibacterium sp. D39]
MSKTLGEILTVGAAIAVNVIPGIGQALSAAITIAGLKAGVDLLGLGPSAPKPATNETAIKPRRLGSRLTR